MKLKLTRMLRMARLLDKAKDTIRQSLNPFNKHDSPFNNHPRPADPNAPTDLVWLLDNTAAQDSKDPNSWRTSFVAAFFAKNSGHIGKHLVEKIMSELEENGLLKNEKLSTDELRKRVEARVLPFFREVVEGRSVDVQLKRSDSARAEDGAAIAEHTIGPSNDDGVARDEVGLSGTFQDGSIAHARCKDLTKHLPAYTTFAAPEGWAVVSDIDDTIKVTLTDHVSGVLKTTFLDEPEAIKGMPELYWHMNDVLENPPFWYLSASPYNLYPFLHDFRDRYYPRGTLELRIASWQNLMHFLESINKGTQEYKIEKMEERIFKYWPKRKLVCIGDSTQSDPEVYGEIERRHPEWVGAIFIRRVTGVVEPGDGLVPGRGDEERNANDRFEKAFSGVDRAKWYVFDDPRDLYTKVEGLVKQKI